MTVVPTPDLAVRLLSRTARIVSATCLAAAGVGVVALAALIVLAHDPPLLPANVARLFVLWIVLPVAIARLVAWTCRARARVDDDLLVLDRRGLRVEVPCEAIARLGTWRVPLPEPGIVVGLRSGRRLGWRIALDDPARLLERLADTHARTAAAGAVASPGVRYASARAAGWRRSLPALLAKFPGFALLPGTSFFITHQWIAYGGPRGQYLLEGVVPYATTFAVYWTTMTIYLALWAGLWRGAAEAACLGLALVAPARADGTRRIAEWTCRAVYFVGVPTLVALRYLA